MTRLHNPLDPIFPEQAADRHHWGRLYGSSASLAIHCVSTKFPGLVIVVTPDTPSAIRMDKELNFFASQDPMLPVLHFPDWETLPYDVFSPHQDIISERLSTLYQLPNTSRGILVVPINTLMTRLAPRSYLESYSLFIDVNQKLEIEHFRQRLTLGGYQCVSTVYEHGEFAVRGNIVDLFPMGSRKPYRIDLFDDEIESIRSFDPDTQRSQDRVDALKLLPAREFPLNKDGVTQFRQSFRKTFDCNPQASTIYNDVSNQLAPGGIEYYMPLFFEQTCTLFDYLPDTTLFFYANEIESSCQEIWQSINQRYEQRRYNLERPILEPKSLFLQANEIFAEFGRFPQIKFNTFAIQDNNQSSNFNTESPPQLTLDIHSPTPSESLKRYIDNFDGRILLLAETVGRRETLLEMFHSFHLYPTNFNSWKSFLTADAKLGIGVSSMEHGLLINTPNIAVISELQLFGEQVLQKRRRKKRGRDTDSIVSHLAELTIGSPVVHEDNGVGRYLGLKKISVGDIETEFMTLEYAGGDKLYIPVSSLHLISRYTGISPDKAPLHKLGSGQWEKAKKKASEKVNDVAAELLEIYARREARKGFAYDVDDSYHSFAATFPFEETPDQEEAINNVINDMQSERPMDRLICGDVGFGKTEVAIRATFIAIQSNKQVAVLVPTTLLAQQHFQTFMDRLADWPVRVESLSRFQTKKEQDTILIGLEKGTIDVVIGTHKLLQQGIKFKNLGLLVIDEEHRFGVRQKERFKALRSEIDVLTLTATPIPRTLNISLSGIRDLSIIATPPARRLAIKTFVSQSNEALLIEACQREITRGGQVYFVHNQVQSIEKTAKSIAALVPNANVRIGHGQMNERDLEHVMLDFYHQRFNILVCTTIIETGIDVPTANTMIIDRADRFGLAQLYQLRGRVGRSHHQAYAYLLVPPRKLMTQDALKRLEAIESIHDLGAGFTLATHDLEIRGAGELLGDVQSGQVQEIGFTLYAELLERAVHALKSGLQPELDRPLDHGTEIEMSIPALIPEDYIYDVHTRLVMYKRIASAKDERELRELQVELIDRFGLLPEQVKNLFRTAELKLKATPLSIRKIEMADTGGRFIFNPQPNIDPIKIIDLIQTKPNTYRLDGADKLRITIDLVDKDAKFKFVDQLLSNFM